MARLGDPVSRVFRAPSPGADGAAPRAGATAVVVVGRADPIGARHLRSAAQRVVGETERAGRTLALPGQRRKDAFECVTGAFSWQEAATTKTKAPA